MWCEIKNTDYKDRLIKQLGERNAKEFALGVQSPSFENWFGKGKTISVGSTRVPFVNPIMQIFNEQNKSLNLLERYKWKSVDDVKAFFSTKYTPGITSTNALFSVDTDGNRYINQKLFQEIDRIYPSLFTQVEDGKYQLDQHYDFNSKGEHFDIKSYAHVAYSKSEDAILLDEAHTLLGEVKNDIYRLMAEQDLKGTLFFIAQQINSSMTNKDEAIDGFGSRLVQIAGDLFPLAKTGQTLEEYEKQSITDNREVLSSSVKTLLDKLSTRFGISYKVVNDPSFSFSGYFNGKDGVVINAHEMDKDTPFHEFLHPFMIVLKKENPTLYKNLIDELKSTEIGIKTIAKVQRDYKELTQEEQLDEAAVTYLGQLSAIKYDEQSSVFNRFIKWLKRLFKKINMINFKDLSLETTLGEIADMIVDDLQVADLQAAIRDSSSLTNYQKTNKDTDLTYDAIFDKIKDKVAILNATIKKRKQGDNFKEEIAALNEMIKNADEITSINNFVANSLKYVESAYGRFEALRNNVKNPSGMSKEDINYNLYLLGEIQQLLNVFDSLEDIQLLFVKEGQKYGSDTMNKLSEAIAKHQIMVNDFKPFATSHIAEWLYPYIETTNNRLIAEGRQDSVLTKDKFKEQLAMASKDISYIGYLMGASINSQDPISAAVGLALKDILYDNHVKDLEVMHGLTSAYHTVKSTGVFTTKANEEEFNLQFLREIENYEQIGEDEDGKEIWGYAKRLAFHTEYNTAQYDKARREFFRTLGDRPNRATDLKAYKAWNEKRAKFYAENTQTNPNAQIVIQQKKQELSKRQFERWLLDNTFVMEDDVYASGMSKSDYFRNSGKLYSINNNNGTFRIFSGELIKPSEKYRNKDFGVMMANPYYSKLFNAYQNSNNKLGTYALRHGIIPQVSKGKNKFAELKWKAGVKENLKTLAKGAYNSIKGEYDPTKSIQRQDGSEVKHVAISYTKLLDNDDVKTDLLSSVLKFSQMANNYEGLSEIEPNIIVLKTILNGDINLGIKGRQIAKTNASGKGIINAITKKVVPKMGQEDMLNKRLNEFIDDVVFGDSEFKESFGIKGHEISLNKIADKVGLITSLSNMALNFTGGISNVVVGNFNNMIEAVGGRFYGKRDWAWANKQYWNEIPDVIGAKVGHTESLLEDLALHYDVPQGEFRNEYGQKVSGSFLNKQGVSTLFFLQSAGEHHIQLTGMLAHMHATKVKTKDGAEVTLFDAWKASKGSPVGNSDYQWTKEDDFQFRNRLHAITKNLQGVYNKFDKSVLARRWYGKLGLMFRKYIFTAFQSRYGSQIIDYEMGTARQGYWTAFFNKFVDDVKDYKWGVINRMWTKEGYNELQKEAMNKTLFEVGVIIAAFILSNFAANNDDDKNWIEAEAALQLTRMSSDITQYINPGDFIRVIRNPAASVNLAEKYIKIVQQLGNPTEVYKRNSGIAKKGDNKLYIDVLKVMPVIRQVINFMTPEEQIKFYKLTTGR